MTFRQMRENILFKLIYLHIVTVDWWMPTIVKYRVLLSFLLIYLLCFYTSIFSFFPCLFVYYSVRTIMYKRTYRILVICSNVPVWLHIFLSYGQKIMILVLCVRLAAAFIPVISFSKVIWGGCNFSVMMPEEIGCQGKLHCHCCNIRIYIWEWKISSFSLCTWLMFIEA